MLFSVNIDLGPLMKVNCIYAFWNLSPFRIGLQDKRLRQESEAKLSEESVIHQKTGWNHNAEFNRII